MEKDQEPNNGPQTTQKFIQPLNADEVRANVAQNDSIQQATPAQVTPAPLSGTTPNGLNDGEEWKPNTPLARRIPALRNYGMMLVAGSLLFMYLNRSIWQFSHQGSAKNLGIIIYVVLGIMLISGITVLLSKSKAFVQLCLNIVIGIAILIGILSLLSLNIITIVLAIIIIGSVMNIKRYVNRAA